MTVLLLLFVVPRANAQERPAPAVDLTAAWIGFADDGIAGEPGFGGAFRWYMSPRIAIGPELLYIRGDSHSHLVLTGNLTWDVLPQATHPKATPFLVAGAGMFQTHEEFFDDAVTSKEGAFTAGGGIRSRVADRISVGVDARVGWELHIRIGGFVAISVGR
ncbi:MAG: outer membrane beta-barrel protein [Vicinamibacterales bacterium]